MDRTIMTLLAASGLALAGCDQQNASDGQASHDHADHDHADHSHDEVAQNTDPDVGDAPASGETPQPAPDEFGLTVGSKAPAASLVTAEGERVSLESLHADGPVVVTFYRGGWCPYCNQALTEWEGRTGDLQSAGARLVALTPEAPVHAGETATKNNLGFSVLSDASFEAADGFGIRFSLDDETQSKYQQYGINLGEWNASKEWSLPHPATYVIDQEGVIRWRWVQEDYSTRAAPDDVIAAVNAL